MTDTDTTLPPDLDALADAVAGKVIERLAPRLSGHQPPADPEALLNEDQAAALLGLQSATLATWRSRGGGPVFCRLGDSKKPACRYRRADLLAWASQRRHSNTGHQLGAEDKGDG